MFIHGQLYVVASRSNPKSLKILIANELKLDRVVLQLPMMCTMEYLIICKFHILIIKFCHSSLGLITCVRVIHLKQITNFLSNTYNLNTYKQSIILKIISYVHIQITLFNVYKSHPCIAHV